MTYTVYFVNEQYIFLYENNERKKLFKGNFNFVLENLTIQDEPEGATGFKMEL